MKTYLIVIERCKNNCSAFSPDVPGCISTGDTVEETLDNMRDALRTHLDGEESPPEPRGLEYHLADDPELHDPGLILTSIPVEEVSPLAHA
ncbi:MAG: type II toxin-antitoxin system HicB family antitoxin [Opitutaceae bacterium]|nr:type II toxin-antitoxin system HicB family antitoxin [Opitutaceae bacterium]